MPTQFADLRELLIRAAEGGALVDSERGPVEIGDRWAGDLVLVKEVGEDGPEPVGFGDALGSGIAVQLIEEGSAGVQS